MADTRNIGMFRRRRAAPCGHGPMILAPYGGNYGSRFRGLR